MITEAEGPEETQGLTEATLEAKLGVIETNSGETREVKGITSGESPSHTEAISEMTCRQLVDSNSLRERNTR